MTSNWKRTLLVVSFGFVPSLIPKDGHAAQELVIEAIYTAPGPWAVAHESVYDAKASATYELFRPSDLGRAGHRHAVLVWGNGTGAVPGQYSRFLSHMASWGFVVVASTSQNTGTGQEMIASLDWIMRADEDPSSTYYHALDRQAVGTFGHSQGAGGSINAYKLANASGDAHAHVSTVVPIELPAQRWICFNSGDPTCKEHNFYSGSDITSGSIFFVNGNKDGFISPSNQDATTAGEQSMRAFYDAVPDGTVKARATLIGADHNDIQDSCSQLGCGGIGPQPYFGYVTAWMRYRLTRDPVARWAFAGSTPEFLRNTLRWENQAHRP
ncbi:hypothetical protein LZC95_48055 [Pendulispora brunnea]|uniref:Alpha/beta hydrolase n=1 Tax=Pendulispora brunnea TaxID=2905690 RepID=A0ABZ2K661_9BACT